jgi:hypothetical protein
MVTKADPKTSDGARVERAAFRQMLRRRIKLDASPLLTSLLDWVLQRQERYDNAPGGLGKAKRR